MRPRYSDEARGSRPPLSDCVQEAPALPIFPHGASEEGNEVREACSDVITAACRLKDIIDVSPDDDNEEHQVARRYIDVMSAIADLTNAVIAYNGRTPEWSRTRCSNGSR